MLGKLGELTEGYNVLTEMNGQCSDMLMDIGIYKMSNGKEELLFDNKNETAVLLLEGAIRLEWEGMEQVIQRHSVFEENPWCLHVSKNVKVTITALSDSEVLVQKTDNDQEFASKLYTPNECQSVVAGDGVWEGTAQRVIRTIFDYNNAVYSNMVVGEVISYPGDGLVIRHITMINRRYIIIALTNHRDLDVQWLVRMHIALYIIALLQFRVS